MDPLTLAMIAVLIVVGYFLIIRPQQKRAKETAALQASIQEGSRVMMSGGIFGTVRHMGEKQVVVEVSPGVELTFVRQAIIRPLKDDEDEFEYADVAEPTDVETAPSAIVETEPASPLATSAAADAGVTDEPVVDAPVNESAEPTREATDKA
ncbi:MAG TPA: preprotein translocase subunit YajC [Propionibacteriaceae bacterium]|nr:preprotein translocase subunit YajC [Propionibacteriaceae bacterium]